MRNDPALCLCLTTVAEVADANALAQKLIEQRAAACVQLDAPMQSLYRWDGKLCQQSEVRLVIKTTVNAKGRVEQLLAEHHPYQVPQVIWIHAADAPADYAAWVHQQTETR